MNQLMTILVPGQDNEVLWQTQDNAPEQTQDNALSKLRIMLLSKLRIMLLSWEILL